MVQSAFFFQRSGVLRDLHSFPTRRSSDLSLDAAKDFPGALIGSGAGTDHLSPGADVTVDDVIRAYEEQCAAVEKLGGDRQDRKSTRLNSSHPSISYAVFCLKKKNTRC